MMKFYGSISGDRASKGQGGHNYLAIKLMYRDEGRSKTLCKLYMSENERGEIELINEETDEVIFVVSLKDKQKKLI